MKKIAAIVEPFVMEQKVLIYEDGKIIEEKAVKLESLADTIVEACNNYNINQVDMYGPAGIASMIGEKAASQYALSDLISNYI